MTGGIFPGDVVRYVPPTTWCRDGIAIAKERRGEVVFIDTYWVTDQTVVSPGSFEFLFNLSDYEEKPRHVWETFAPADRQYIGKQHHCYPTYLVRKGAVPDLGTQIGNARDRVSNAESKLASAQWGLDFARRELAELEAQAGKP